MKDLENYSNMATVTSTSDDEREEEEMRLEREARWAPTYSRWDVLPAVPREGPKVIKERTDILAAYSNQEFKDVYRFEKPTFLEIVDIVDKFTDLG